MRKVISSMANLKVLIVGSDERWSIERLYSKYMTEAGATIELFAAQNLFFDYYQQSLINKLRFRLGASPIFSVINRQLLEKATVFQPDVVWIFKGMEVLPATISELKKRGEKVLNYNPDNPFIFTGSGSGNKNVTRSIGLYDLHFTYSKEIEKQLMTGYDAKTVYLPFGYDLADSLYTDAANQEEVMRCCFLGNPDRKRARFIRELADANIEMDLYGNFWGSYIKKPGVRIYPPVYGAEFYRILRRYRVQLNMMRLHNLRSHNMRSFEIPAVGGIQLAPDTPEHRLFYFNDKEIFLYNNARDCVDKIRKLLSLSFQQAQEVRLKARARSVESGYSYKHRSVLALEAMKELLHA